MANDDDLDWRSETKRKDAAAPLLKKLGATSAPPAQERLTDWSGEVRAPKPPKPQVEKYAGPAYFRDPEFFRMVIVFAGWTQIGRAHV